MLVRLGAFEPAGAGVENSSPGRHRARAGREVACGPAQEAGLDSRVGVEDDDYIPGADVWLGGAESRALTVRQPNALSANHTRDAIDPELTSGSPHRLAGAVH